MVFRQYFILGLLLFVVGLFFCLTQEIIRTDEVWFLQVVNRILSGEILYKDIFFGAGPLPIYITSLFCLPFGAELIIARLVLNLYFVASILISCAILKELNVSKRFSLAFILTFIFFSHFQATWANAAYNNLAKVFFLACYYCALKWYNVGTTPKKSLFLSLSSVFSGLCFCSKQNVGGISLLTLVAIIAYLTWKKHISIKDAAKKTSLIFSIFFLVTGFCLLPTILQGGLSKYLEYGIFNKAQYLKLQHCGYFLASSKYKPYTIFIFLAPFLLVLSFLSACPKFKKERDAEWVIVVIFLLGALLTLYPRPNHPQKMVYFPFALIAITYFCSRIPQLKSLLNFKPINKGLTLFLAVLLPISLPISFKEKKVISRIPHFRGIFMEETMRSQWRSMRKRFTSEEKPIFFLSTQAGFYYLLFNLKNPTPFDYPIHPALGLNGEEEVIRQIKSSEIGNVYFSHEDWRMLPDRRPYHLEEYLKNRMEKIDNPIFQVLRPCDG